MGLQLYSGESCDSEVPRLVAFSAVPAADVKLKGKFHRFQLPIEPAYASTMHMAQVSVAIFL